MRYFAYGSNMSAAGMKRRGVNFTSREHASLPNLDLAFNKTGPKPGMGYANIVTWPGRSVEGVLYEIDEQGAFTLDKYEGAPTHYARANVIVVENGKLHEAMTFVAQRTAVGLKPTREYLEALLAGRDILPIDYIAKLEKTSTLD